MGTTASILEPTSGADDDGVDVDEDVAVANHHDRHSHSRPSSQRRHGSASTLSAAAGANEIDSSRQQQHRQRRHIAVVANINNENHHDNDNENNIISPGDIHHRQLRQHQQQQQQQPQNQQRSKLRHTGICNGRVRHNTTSVPTMFHLNGLIVGMPKTGKRTLLQRFQGIDPYQNQQQQRVGNNNLHSNPDPTTTTTTKEIIIPYQTNRIVWDNRIQLSLRMGQEINSLSAPQQQDAIDNLPSADFVIILVHPHHERETVQSYLTDIIHSILQNKGYASPTTTEHQSNSNKKDDDDDMQETKASPQQPLQRPICICILLNFRDLLLKVVEESSTASTVANSISVEDLEVWAKRIILDYIIPNSPLEQQRHVVLQVEQASLRNCYGLNALHHFIYRSYLQWKQYETEQYLWNIQQQVQTASKEIPHVPYPDFLKLVVPSTTTTSAAATTRAVTNHVQPQKQQQRRKLHQQQQLTSTQHSSQPYQNHVDDMTRGSKDQVDASTWTKEETQPVPHKVRPKPVANYSTRQSLEAFLESDDDDVNGLHGQEGWNDDDGEQDEMDDDDDDDGFFFDDTGRRQGSVRPSNRHTVLAKTSHTNPSSQTSAVGNGASTKPSTESGSSTGPPTKPQGSRSKDRMTEGTQNPGKYLHTHVAQGEDSVSVSLEDTKKDVIPSLDSDNKTVSGNIPNKNQGGQCSDSMGTNDTRATTVTSAGLAIRDQVKGPGDSQIEDGHRQMATSEDIVNLISELEVQDGWGVDSNDGYDDDDDDAAAVAERSQRGNSLPARLESYDENDDDDDDGYMIGEETPPGEPAIAVVATMSLVDQDDDDLVIERNPSTVEINDAHDMQVHISPSESTEVAAPVTKSSLSRAALQAIEEAQRNAEQMLRENEAVGINDVDYKTNSVETSEKKSKKKKKAKDDKDPSQKKKKGKKRREQDATTAYGEEINES